MKMRKAALSPLGLCLLLSAITGGAGLVSPFTNSHRVIAFATDNVTTPAPLGSKEEAFGVLNDFTRSVDKPRWEESHWETYCELELNTLCSPPPPTQNPDQEAEASQKLTVNLTLPPQRTPGQSQPFSIFQSIYYNPGAARWITSNHLNNVQQLLTVLGQPQPTGGTRTVTVPPDPASPSTPNLPGTPPHDLLVVVKTEWEIVQPHSHTGSGATARSLDGYLQLLTVPVDFDTLTGAATDETHDALVDVTHPGDRTCHDSFAADGKTHIYSLNCFFHRRLTAKDASKLGMLPKALQDDMKSTSCVQGNCYLILVGIHLISNESPSWTWRTYWWTAAKPGLQWNSGVLADNKVLAGNKWSFFDTNATVDGKARVANPYLEGSVNGGMKSNCIGCHQYAAHSAQTSAFGAFLKCATSPSSLPVDCPGSPAYFAQSVRTHSLWTIALNNRCSLDNPSPLCPAIPLDPPTSASVILSKKKASLHGVE